MCKPGDGDAEPTQLRLHSLHEGTEPVLAAAFASTLKSFKHETAFAEVEEDSKLAHVSLDGRFLSLPGDKKLLILGTKVKLACDSDSEFPVIVVAESGESTLADAPFWLLVVAKGKAKGAREVLQYLGEAGAVRADFCSCWEMGSTAFGSGSNADVFLAQPKPVEDGSGEEEPSRGVLAVKVLHPKEDEEKEVKQLPTEFKREVELLTIAQNHPNLVRFKGLFVLDKPTTVGPRWAVAMEYYAGGDLFDEISRSSLSESRSREVIKGLLSAILHLHELNIVHRDVKAENVLLTKDGRPILADLGIACVMSDSEEMVRRCGSPGYMAPEILLREGYDGKVDVFSVGVILFMSLCGRMPFAGPNMAATLRRTIKQPIDFEISSKFDSVSKQCKEYILSLTEKKPASRPTSAEALAAQWITAPATPAGARKRSTALSLCAPGTGALSEVLRAAEDTSDTPTRGSGASSSNHRNARSLSPAVKDGARGSTGRSLLEKGLVPVPPPSAASPSRGRYKHPARQVAAEDSDSGARKPGNSTSMPIMGKRLSLPGRKMLTPGSGSGASGPSPTSSPRGSFVHPIHALGAGLSRLGSTLSGMGRAASRKEALEFAKDEGEKTKMRFRRFRRAAGKDGGKGGKEEEDEDEPPAEDEAAHRCPSSAAGSSFSGCFSLGSSLELDSERAAVQSEGSSIGGPPVAHCLSAPPGGRPAKEMDKGH